MSVEQILIVSRTYKKVKLYNEQNKKFGRHFKPRLCLNVFQLALEILKFYFSSHHYFIKTKSVASFKDILTIPRLYYRDALLITLYLVVMGISAFKFR